MNSLLQEDERSTLPLAPEQRAVWSAIRRDGVEDASLVCNGVWMLVAEVAGELDVKGLRAAVAHVVQRHEVLQYAFCRAVGYTGVRQSVRGGAKLFAWSAEDLRESLDPAAELKDHLAELGSGAFDLEQGELLRVKVIRTASEAWTFALAACAMVVDRLSVQTLFREIVGSNDDPDPESPPFQYSQYLEWREDLAQDVDAAESRDYWARHIEGDAPGAPMLSYRTQSGDESVSGVGRVSRRLDTALMSRVETVAAVRQISVEAIYQAAWWAVLARITGNDCFVVGWRHDCRRDYTLMRDAVGVFEKVLPLTVSLSLEESFASWAGRLGETLDAHIGAQEYWAVEAPPLRAHLSVGFDFVEGVNLVSAASPQWRVVELRSPESQFELGLQVTSGDGSNEVAVTWHRSLYSAVAAETLLSQYMALLSAAIESPSTGIGALPLGYVAPYLAGESVDYGDRTVGETIAQWAVTSPQEAAIESSDATLSYADLDRRVNQVGRWMQAMGVVPGSLVCLDMERSVDWVVAMLATWRLGAAFLPVQPDWPAMRREAILADAKPTLVVHGTLPDIDFEALPNTLPVQRASLNDIAYVLYTSGSTGKPKGVIIEHRNLLNYAAASSAALGLGDSRRWALMGSVAADLQYTALFGALFNGACLVVAAPNEVQDGHAFSRFISTRAIDGLKIVPSHLEALLESEIPVLPRKIVLGGEATSRALLDRLKQLAPECEVVVYNHYGPTETTVGVMIHRVDLQSSRDNVVPLTTVLPNCWIQVLDKAMAPVPLGALGEVYVGGAQVCRGYLNGDRAAAFVEDPISAGERLYRTGDLAYRLPEGGIRIAGRVDHQLKIQGFRVEPAEIEAALLLQGEVRQAAVLPRLNEGSIAELLAFVVTASFPAASSPASTEEQKLRDGLAAILPAYMLPSRFVFLDEFPRLANGKVDRLALASLGTGQAARGERSAPRDAIEHVIADCMAGILKREGVGVDEDFFDLGGHSLLVIKLVARIRKRLSVDLQPATVFDHRTAATLALALRANNGGLLDARASA